MEPMLLLLQEEAFCCARPPNDSLSGERGVGGYERTIYASVGRAFDRTAAGTSCYSTPTKLGSLVQDSDGDGPTICKFPEQMFRRSMRFARA